MSLPDEKREALTWAVAEEACIHTGGVDPDATTGCRDCQRIADALAPLVAGWLAEAEREGLKRGTKGAPRLYRSGYERGGAEVAAGVEAVCAQLQAEDDHGKSAAARRVRSALADRGALDRVRAEALREAADAARGMFDPPAAECAEWADWLDARADRMEGR